MQILQITSSARSLTFSRGRVRQIIEPLRVPAKIFHPEPHKATDY